MTYDDVTEGLDDNQKLSLSYDDITMIITATLQNDIQSGVHTIKITPSDEAQ
jgi:hypothetical protein